MSGGNVEIISKSDSNFTPTFIDQHLISDLNFNGHCLINNIYTPKKHMYMFLSTKFMVKNFKLLHWIIAYLDLMECQQTILKL